VEADLAKVEDNRRLVAAADQYFGMVHLLVTAAGVPDRETIWGTTPELWDWIRAINVRVHFLLIQETVKIMVREGDTGSIVNIGSVSAYGSVPFLMGCATSKGTLMTLTKNVAYPVMCHRIRITMPTTGHWLPSLYRSCLMYS
jgi:NAD(P)-dependent dehydrogenase (short-subunit alcohol dehydrogenase family)